jgi:SAM-dependent methyltransferase
VTTHYWDAVWDDRNADEVTWFQAEPAVSMRLIRGVAGLDAGIIDVGGGASRLIDHLLEAGYHDVTVLDVAAASIGNARQRLGAQADRATWVVADATDVDLGRTFDVWHDRAVLHFMVDAADRERYLMTLRSAVAMGGHVVLATFGPDGPEWCSGLPVRRYSIELMHETLGSAFELVDHEIEQHVAPSGSTQQFVYGLFRRIG